MTLATFILLLPKAILFLFQVTETSLQNNFHLAFIHKTIQKLYHITSITI